LISPNALGIRSFGTKEESDVATVTTERHLAAIAERCTRPANGEQLFADVSTRLRGAVPFDGAAWFATDPATILATCPVRIENVEDGHCESYWEREFRVEDAILFRDLARAENPVSTLYNVTDEHPCRSARYREFLQPQGYGDELRAALRLGDSTWGVIDLYRERSRPAFSATDVSIVRAVIPMLAAALRSFATASSAVRTAGVVDGPGTALFDGKTLVSLDEQAERLFAELAGPHWMTLGYTMSSVYAVVARASAVFAGRDRGPASARLRGTSGRWLSVHASCLRRPDGTPGPTALTIEPAKSAQIAPIIVEAYCLTVREQEITRLVARGLSNPEIAQELHLSPHTVRDHLKAIFGKVGVGTRGELVAKLLAEHYGPALHTPDAAVAHVNF
jgi:DNA-binding CsgD family transcriptional regulator